MDLLFVSEYFPPARKGGGEQSCFLLARSLVHQGINVTVLTSHFPGLLHEEIIEGIRILRKLSTGDSPEKFWSNIKREIVFPQSLHRSLKKLIAQEPFDIIHYFNTTSILGKLSQHETAIPQIMHVNSPVVFCPLGTLMYETKEAYASRKKFLSFVKSFVHAEEFGKMKNAFYYRYNPCMWLYLFYSFKRRNKRLHAFDQYVAVSPFMQQLLEEEGIAPQHISSVPNILELTAFMNASQLRKKQKEKGIKNRVKRILYLGLYMKNKGVYVLLDALQKLSQQFSISALSYTCDFYGSGPEKENIDAYVKEHNLSVKIHDAVAPELVPRILAEHDIVVFPSLIPESFGRVVIEAQASGAVAVASKIGGTQYLIENGKTGYLFTPGNAQELAEILQRVLKKDSTKIVHTALVSVKQYEGTYVAKKMITVYNALQSSQRHTSV